MSGPATDSPKPRRKHVPWTVLIFAATTIIIVVILLVAYLKTTHDIKETVNKGMSLLEKAVDKAPEIARNFKTGNITHTFRESLPQLSPTGGDVLELAVSRSDETFSRTDERRIGWDLISLGKTVVEIRVPVTFRYHLRLSDTWRLASRDHVCVVLAPQIRPSLPPAIDTAGMEKRAESGWARFDKNEKLDELEKSLTASLEKRAMDPGHMQLAREACRQSVAEFVKKWLMKEEYWSKDRFSAIIVVFPDEIHVTSDQELLRIEREPSARLE